MGVSVIETMIEIMKLNDLSRVSRADKRVQKLEVHLWVEGLRSRDESAGHRRGPGSSSSCVVRSNSEFRFAHNSVL